MSGSLLPSEAEVQATLVDAAMLRGYRVAHFRPARTAKGWRTPLEGHAGFVDLVLARDARAFAWEVKGARGSLELEQTYWRDALGGGRPSILEWGLVTPATLDLALEALDDGMWPRR